MEIGLTDGSFTESFKFLTDALKMFVRIFDEYLSYKYRLIKNNIPIPIYLETLTSPGVCQIKRQLALVELEFMPESNYSEID